MNRLTSYTIKKIFAKELKPSEKHWWQKIDFENLKSQQAIWIGAGVAVILLSGVYYYNKFIELHRFTEMEQHQIEVMLQRRKDLSFNLTTTVIDYAKHERTMFQYVTNKREETLKNPELLMNALKDAGIMDMVKNSKGAGSLDQVAGKFMALAEAYPELKLSANFQKLMDALITSEDRIADRRLAYNHAASVFHAYVRQVPACFYAFIFGYRENMFHYVSVDSDVSQTNRIRY
ncbi:MAG: LemA family protein [Candidatus Omnitrophica bacterium]|nr:LemA family protein [Candidatus Omnitrophota bacterium]